jgi:RNA polymerase sigma factor (sigma-70 family)
MRADASQPAASLRLRPVSDERLVSRLRGGDSRAFEAIYDRYERPIRSFCRHMLGQPEDADDAAQHTFLAAYRELVGSDKQIDLRPWLFTVARNRCRTLLRARYRGMAFSEPMACEPSVEGLGVEVERREHLRDLMRDIARLPEDQRAALLLTQLETLRHDEVARVLDVPAEKVKALVFQARSSLVASELARETPCGEIRQQLATLSGAGLRRRTLRRHVRDCPGCREFEQRLKRQRHAILVLLPVASSPVVRDAVAAHLAGGAAAGGAAAGGVATGGGAAAGGGLTALVGNAVAVKTATVLSVAAAGAGVAAVATGVHVAGTVRQHTSGGQSATLTVGNGAAAPAVHHRLVVTEPAAPPALPRRKSAAHARSAPRHRSAPIHRTVAIKTPPAADVPAASAPVATQPAPSAPKTENENAVDTAPPGQVRQKDEEPASPPPGQPKQQEEPAAALPPGQAKKQDPNSLPPGQAKKQESGSSLPPGQAKKQGDTPTPGNGNGNGNRHG